MKLTLPQFCLRVTAVQCLLNVPLMALPGLSRQVFPAWKHHGMMLEFSKAILLAEMPIPALMLLWVTLRPRWESNNEAADSAPRVTVYMILFGANASAYSLAAFLYYSIHCLGMFDLEPWLWFPAMLMSLGYGLHLRMARLLPSREGPHS